MQPSAAFYGWGIFEYLGIFKKAADMGLRLFWIYSRFLEYSFTNSAAFLNLQPAFLNLNQLFWI
jgi:hypothetical protein